MTNINEVMERLEDDAAALGNGQGGYFSEAAFSEHAADLKALLSYTKQCREALSKIAACEVRYPGDLVSVARQALSTQPGERE